MNKLDLKLSNKPVDVADYERHHGCCKCPGAPNSRQVISNYYVESIGNINNQCFTKVKTIISFSTASIPEYEDRELNSNRLQ